jgi:hypothetical protein
MFARVESEASFCGPVAVRAARRSDKAETALPLKGAKTTVLSEWALTERDDQAPSKRQVAGSSPAGVANISITYRTRPSG